VSWLQKISQSKPMALPFQHPSETGANYDNGVSRIDEGMTEETAEKEKKRRNPSYLGSGYYGIATDIGNDFVCKYSDDLDEVEMAKYVKNNPIPCVVNIHDIVKIQESPMIFGIIMDKVETIQEYDEKIIINSLRFNWKNEYRILELKQRYDNHKMIDDYIKMSICLRDNNIETGDAHAGNVGRNSDGEFSIV